MIRYSGGLVAGIIMVAVAMLLARPVTVFAAAAAPTALSRADPVFTQTRGAVQTNDVDESMRGLQLAQAGEIAGSEVSGSGSLKFEIRSYRVDGNTLLLATDIESLLRAYTGKSRDFGDVQQALEALQALYTERGYTGIRISLPEQELERGDVTFKVVEPRIARVLVEGNEHFSADNARNSVPSLVPGTSPNARKIAASVRVANESPAKQSVVLLRPAERDGEVDAVIRMADVAPLRYSISFDDTGTKETGKHRIGFSMQHANLLDLDHILTAQYVTSPENPKDVSVLGLGYRIPFYARGDSLDLIAGYSRADSGVVQNLFDVSGQGTIYIARYNQNFQKWGNVEQRLVYSFDYRVYQNLVTPVGGTFNFVPDVTVHPVGLTYSGQLRQDQRELNFYLGYSQNIAGGNDGTDDVFKASRHDARAAYRIWRFGFTHTATFFKEWQYRLKLDGQYSPDALIAAEQFGMGGAESVRGFNERYSTNDNGHRVNMEVYTPEFGRLLGLDTARVRLLGFYDTGHTSRNFPQPGELHRMSLDSVGFGIRMSYGTHLTVRGDFAQVIHDGTQTNTPTGRTNSNRLHFLVGYVF